VEIFDCVMCPEISECTVCIVDICCLLYYLQSQLQCPVHRWTPCWSGMWSVSFLLKSNVLLARDRSIDIGNIVYISPMSIYRYCIGTLDISFSIYRYCIGDKWNIGNLCDILSYFIQLFSVNLKTDNFMTKIEYLIEI